MLWNSGPRIAKAKDIERCQKVTITKCSSTKTGCQGYYWCVWRSTGAYLATLIPISTPLVCRLVKPIPDLSTLEVASFLYDTRGFVPKDLPHVDAHAEMNVSELGWPIVWLFLGHARPSEWRMSPPQT